MNNSTGCSHFIDSKPDLANQPIIIALFFLLYMNIFILGIVGNLAVLYLTMRNRQLQSVQNIFILNLAISDVLMCLTSVPITPITSIYKTWFFGSPVCKLIPLVQGASIFVSTFSLSAIALDRYNLVCRPHCHPLHTRGATVVAILFWILAVVVCTPYGWYMNVEKYPGLCGEYCSESWPNMHIRNAYALMVLIMQFIFPFATMAVCYYSIFSRLRQRTETKLKKLTERSQLLEHSTATPTKTETNDSPTVNSIEERQRFVVLAQQRRTTTILASMVLLFGVTWLPHNIVTLIIEYNEDFFLGQEVNHTYIVSLAAHATAMLTNVANPFLYAWLNPAFKEILLRSIHGKLRNRQDREKKDTIIRVAKLGNSGTYSTTMSTIESR